MGLFNLLFNDSSSESNEGSEEKMYNVRIKGTIQANGPKTINRIVQMDRTQMLMFTGSKRYEAIEGWIRANYPGAKIPSIRGFTA
ncbi:MAG: hypothetical protein LBR26_12250, partial [Prevotella sp.]|nr:hypothetical protein [Prevotella sp.]